MSSPVILAVELFSAAWSTTQEGGCAGQDGGDSLVSGGETSCYSEYGRYRGRGPPRGFRRVTGCVWRRQPVARLKLFRPLRLHGWEADVPLRTWRPWRNLRGHLNGRVFLPL